ncbi:MAG: hypothetical protein JNK38_01000 [Acidobacteria bacterium]|nr:hypothetical protein [Acidobacteriota bacterium]
MKKLFVTIFLIFSLTHATIAQQQQPVAVKIAQGTIVQIALASEVRSDQVKEGSQVVFNVVEPVRVKGIIVIDRGAAAIARVEKAKKAGSWGKGGQLIWTIDGTTATDGTRVPLAFTSTAKGDNARGTMLTGVAVTSFFLGPLGLLWGFKKGKQAAIPAGQIFQVAVSEETEVSGVLAIESKAAPGPASTQVEPGQRKCYENGRKVPCP